MSKAEWNDFVGDLPIHTGLVGDVTPQQPLRHQQIDRDCDAVGVGLLAIRAAARGDLIDPLSLVPNYMRLSAAEEKAAKE
jgi:hypothetical protein